MDCYLRNVKDNERVKDHDLGLHPSEQVPYGYQVKPIDDRYFSMRRCANSVYRGWTRCTAHGVPIGARRRDHSNAPTA